MTTSAVLDRAVPERLVDLVRRRVREIGEQHRHAAVALHGVGGGRGDGRAVTVPARRRRRVHRPDAGAARRRPGVARPSTPATGRVEPQPAHPGRRRGSPTSRRRGRDVVRLDHERAHPRDDEVAVGVRGQPGGARRRRAARSSSSRRNSPLRHRGARPRVAAPRHEVVDESPARRTRRAGRRRPPAPRPARRVRSQPPVAPHRHRPARRRAHREAPDRAGRPRGVLQRGRRSSTAAWRVPGRSPGPRRRGR